MKLLPPIFYSKERNFLDENRELSREKLLLEWLYLLWWLTLPFGSKALGISIGFMTLYPNLIITLIISALSISTVQNWPKWIVLIGTFLGAWLVSAIVSTYLFKLGKEALFDVRSLGMQFLFFMGICGMFFHLGKSSFWNNSIIGVRWYLFVLVAVGCVEYLTGMHFEGLTTDKWMALPVSHLHFAPMFTYDNPNDYMCYLMFLGTLLFVVDSAFSGKRLVMVLLFWFFVFVFADYAESRFAKLIALSVLAFHLVRYMYFQMRTINTKAVVFIAVGGIMITSMILSNKVFQGPIYSNNWGYWINSLKVAYKDKNDGRYYVKPIREAFSPGQIADLIYTEDSIQKHNPSKSSNARKTMIADGIDYIKEAPVFGIGPGQYSKRQGERYKDQELQVLQSPHNFLIEIVSQYGLFGWGYCCIILGFFLVAIQKIRKSRGTFPNWLIALFLMLPIWWCMPSAYLYLDINWILVPIIACIFITMSQEKEALRAE